jgi:menaquinone-dependent protoporphyrinogen IX oxidase
MMKNTTTETMAKTTGTTPKTTASVTRAGMTDVNKKPGRTAALSGECRKARGRAFRKNFLRLTRQTTRNENDRRPAKNPSDARNGRKG